ncbi:NAD(P)H-dependent oxidoreductase, partial [Enterobacter kobei]|uniref:NAD(P)H-dependent oxidoreductase n=1 Tax=Enterobacter kobei TaxID=208224 RepID=UPI002075534F
VLDIYSSLSLIWRYSYCLVFQGATSHGWAYGHNGNALKGKSLMWAVTTGGGESHFDIGSFPGFDVLAQPLQATALYCGLNWIPPFAMHCTFVCDDETLQAQARHYKQRLLEWQETHHG